MIVCFDNNLYSPGLHEKIAMQCVLSIFMHVLYKDDFGICRVGGGGRIVGWVVTIN